MNKNEIPKISQRTSDLKERLKKAIEEQEKNELSGKENEREKQRIIDDAKKNNLDSEKIKKMLGVDISNESKEETNTTNNKNKINLKKDKDFDAETYDREQQAGMDAKTEEIEKFYNENFEEAKGNNNNKNEVIDWEKELFKKEISNGNQNTGTGLESENENKKQDIEQNNNNQPEQPKELEKNEGAKDNISNEDWKNFVDNGVASEQIIYDIAIKQINGGEFSKREQDIRKDNAQKIESMLFEIKVGRARQEYIDEYKKCEKEYHKQSKILTLKNSILNLFKDKDNRKVSKIEDFFTQELKDKKSEYDQARIDMGNDMFKNKKAELEKAGISGTDLETALTQYKATDILVKTVTEERQKIINSKAEKQPAMWKKLWDGYRKMPKWKRVMLSTALFLPVTAAGAFGGTFIAYGALGWGALATVKFGASMAIGTVVGYGAKGIDWAKRGSDKRFVQDQTHAKEQLQEKFSKGEIDIAQYESGIKILEDAEKKHDRNRIILKTGLGIAMAGVAGFAAYNAMGYGISNIQEMHHTGIANSTDHLHMQKPSVGNGKIKLTNDQVNEVNKFFGTQDTTKVVADGAKVTTPIVPQVHHEVTATADHGQGAISTIKELQNNLKSEYPDLSKAPDSVKHILNTDATKLAQEYGMYKPGQVDESAFIKSGQSFTVDKQSGDVKFGDTLLEKGSNIKADHLYEGKMFDSDHSGVQEPGVGEHTTSAEHTQIDPVTGQPMHVGETQINPEDGQYYHDYANGHQVDPVTGKDISVGDNKNITLDADKHVGTDTIDAGKNIKLDATVEHATNVDHTSTGEYLSHTKPEEINMDFYSNSEYIKNLKPEEINSLVKSGVLIDHKQITLLGVKHTYELNGTKDLVQLQDYAKSYGVSIEHQSGETLAHYEHRMNEEIILHKNALAEMKPVSLHSVKDIRILTKGYEGVPGQVPIRYVVKQINDFHLNAIETKSVGQTFTAAQLGADSKINTAMDIIKKQIYRSYEYTKNLPNGNVEVMKVVLYK